MNSNLYKHCNRFSAFAIRTECKPRNHKETDKPHDKTGMNTITKSQFVIKEDTSLRTILNDTFGTKRQTVPSQRMPCRPSHLTVEYRLSGVALCSKLAGRERERGWRGGGGVGVCYAGS